MEAVAPSEEIVVVLREISRAGFAYGSTKLLCHSAGWALVDDEPGLGYIRFDMPLTPGSQQQRLLSVLIAEAVNQPRALVPLFCFDEYDHGREPFDHAFDTLKEQLAGFLGAPVHSGAYVHPHRAA